MASGLYEILDALNEDRIQCAKTAKAFGLGNNENMKFSDIPSLLAKKQGMFIDDDIIRGYFYDGSFYSDAEHTEVITPDTSKLFIDIPTDMGYRYRDNAYVKMFNGKMEWERPEEWPDTQSILDNAEIKDGKYPLYIMLLFDDADTTTFNKTGSGIATGGDAWLTSDGEWITTDGTTHTWDKTQDIETSYGYNLRWVIVYGNSTSNISVELYNFAPLIEFIDNEITYSKFQFGNYSISNIKHSLISVKSNTNINGMNTFNYCSSLQYVSLPNLTTISGDRTFYYCSSLQYVSLPNLTTISGGGSTFNYCSSLQYVSLPNLTTISGDRTFYYCSSLQYVSLPNLTTISGGGSTFSYCPSLQYVSLPNLTTISGGSTFSSCSSLQKFIFNSNLINVNFSTMFKDCISLKDVVVWNGWNLSGLDLSPCISMRADSLRQILNALADVTGETGTYTLTFGATNLAKLTAEEQAIATNKGWTLN